MPDPPCRGSQHRSPARPSGRGHRLPTASAITQCGRFSASRCPPAPNGSRPGSARAIRAQLVHRHQPTVERKLAALDAYGPELRDWPHARSREGRRAPGPLARRDHGLRRQRKPSCWRGICNEGRHPRRRLDPHWPGPSDALPHLGDGLARQGAEVRFVCRAHPGHGIALLQAEGFRVATLPEPPAPIAGIATATMPAGSVSLRRGMRARPWPRSRTGVPTG